MINVIHKPISLQTKFTERGWILACRKFSFQHHNCPICWSRR